MMSDSLIGQQLANYRIERLIGRGGMASVYYGWDVKLQRPVAIKVTDIQQQDVAYARRLVREARMMARWHHEHVNQVYYADQLRSLYFFAMEYIDGLDLGALMDRYRQAGELIPHADVVRIGRAIAGALDYAHSQNVIHRDVKPSNVLLSLGGRIVLSDFGLALDVQQGTVGEVLGTPHYLAPEQARDSASAVPQSDLYALGVILYEMLTGSVPFDDPSPMSLAFKHVTEPPPLPTNINPALGIPVEAVLLKALSKAPEDRYSSGEVLMDSLERALALGRDASPDERLRTPVADILAEIATSRETVLKHGEGSSQPVTSPVRLSREKAARRRRTQMITLGTLALGVLAVIALAVALFTGLLRGMLPAPGAATQPVIQQPVGSTASPTAGEPPASVVAQPPAETIPPPAVTVPPAAPASSTAAPTGIQVAGYHLRMEYNEKGFYLFNPGDKAVEVGSLIFESLDGSTGLPAGYRFDAQTWLAAANYFPKLEPGKCDAIEIRLTSAFNLRPSYCRDFNALVTPEQTSQELFWLARPNMTGFRVTWQSTEIARCLTGSSTCDAYLPGQ